LFKTRSRDEWELLLADRDCCVSGIYTPQEALDNPQVKARGLIRMEDGKPLSDLPIKFSDALGAGSGDCPALGADTYNVLAELGLDEAALAALSASGAI
jgi:crotonobetainyl-CoA:carnitine CoA-transferase CaiB-like acyl-CoA transferase